jgi:hypothetical protein
LAKEDLSNEMMSGSWSEKVYIETAEYIIRGYVHMPKIGKRSRLLTEILNTTKQFIAVTDCKVESKLSPQKELESYDFIEVNIATILIMRPIDD